MADKLSEFTTLQKDASPARSKVFNKRLERAHRILDAASALILRWGYDKTTLDDIARQAGVAKGTMYMHWKTREALFEALIRRERLAFAEDFLRRITNDPAGVSLRGIIKHSSISTMKRPLLRALFLNDKEILGKLAQSEFNSESYIKRVEGFKSYLESLREHDLVRTDLSLREQMYIVGVIYVGFFLGGPMMPGEFSLPDEEMAELMAETIHRTLETGRSVSTEQLLAVSQTYIASMNRYVDILREQFLQELEK